MWFKIFKIQVKAMGRYHFKAKYEAMINFRFLCPNFLITNSRNLYRTKHCTAKKIFRIITQKKYEKFIIMMFKQLILIFMHYFYKRTEKKIAIMLT